MFRVPSIDEPLAKTRVGHKGGGSSLGRRRLSFPKKIGKDVDDDLQKFFADSLSLSGKLFEIYFVRLIGTPNQNSKNGINFG